MIFAEGWSSVNFLPPDESDKLAELSESAHIWIQKQPKSYDAVVQKH